MIALEEIFVFAAACFGLGVGSALYWELWQDRTVILSLADTTEEQKTIVRSGPRLVGFVMFVLTVFLLAAARGMYQAPAPAATGGGAGRVVILALFLAVIAWAVWLLFKERTARWQTLRPAFMKARKNHD